MKNSHKNYMPTIDYLLNFRRTLLLKVILFSTASTSSAGKLYV